MTEPRKKRGRGTLLKEIEKRHNESIKTLLPRVIEEQGSVKGASDSLGIPMNLIYYVAKREGWIIQTIQTAKVIVAPVTPDLDTAAAGNSHA